MVRRAADAVEVPDAPLSSAMTGDRSRRSHPPGRTLAVGVLVVAAAAVVAVAFVGIRGSNTAVEVETPAEDGAAPNQPPPDGDEGTGEADTTAKPESDLQRRHAELAAALAEAELPRLTLTSEVGDYSNPWEPPPVRFELPAHWEGNREFVQTGTGTGGALFTRWASDESRDPERFVVVGGGPLGPPPDSESLQAQDGTTWEVSSLDVGIDVVAAFGQPTDGRGVVVFAGFSRDEWEHALRTAPTAYGYPVPGELPSDLRRPEVGGLDASPSTQLNYYFSNVRGPWESLQATVFLNGPPMWAELVGDRVLEAVGVEVEVLGSIGELTRCEWQGDVNVCAALRSEPDDPSVARTFHAELSAWRDGLRVDATVPIAGADESVTTQQVQAAFDLLGDSIVAARIPVP